MPGKLSTITQGIASGFQERAAARISINGRSRTALGPISLVTDVVLFPASTGVWLVPNQRVRVANVPTIDQSSTGLAYANVFPSWQTAMLVAQADPRTKAG